jgi:hypothetical protein
MNILRARLKPFGLPTEFISVPGRIRSMLIKSREDEFHFVIDEEGVKTVKEYGPENINSELVGKTLKIGNSQYFAKFNEDGTIDVVSETNESLPNQRSVNQLKELRKMTKGIDIGDRIPDLMKQGANIHYNRNIIDNGIESFEDFERKNKQFIPSWNLKHLMSPFRKNKKNL